jgi:hypothetical protein
VKTTNFGTVEVQVEGEAVVMTVFSPAEGRVAMRMSTDELMILMVEMHNTLHQGRLHEVARVAARNLEREERR